MSQVKFQQREDIRITNNGGNGGPRGGGFAGRAPQGKEDLAHEVGNALTKGSGPGGYLAVSRYGRYNGEIRERRTRH